MGRPVTSPRHPRTGPPGRSGHRNPSGRPATFPHHPGIRPHLRHHPGNRPHLPSRPPARRHNALPKFRGGRASTATRQHRRHRPTPHRRNAFLPRRRPTRTLPRQHRGDRSGQQSNRFNYRRPLWLCRRRASRAAHYSWAVVSPRQSARQSQSAQFSQEQKLPPPS